MKQGDLVQKNTWAISSDILSGPDWDNPAIIVKGPYEGSFTTRDVVTGKPIVTEVKSVVDVMLSGRLYKSIPVSFLERVALNNREKYGTLNMGNKS